jgi:hypothetical protein
MWHVFTVRIEEKPGGWKVHSNREVGTIAGMERPAGKDIVEELKKQGYLGSKVVSSEDEVGAGRIAAYVLASAADVPKLAQTMLLVMGIGNGPSGADWPMMSLEWKP